MRVFDLFAQAERSADRSLGGLGLGLALVKSLVELHGGAVGCESAGEGQGSRFFACLPCLAGAEPGRDAPAEKLPSAPASTALRILVVDDNIDAAVTLAMLLEVSGHEVQIEHGALAALERARSMKPQACLLDIGLPEMDGKELARRLRAEPATAGATLVAVTGYGQDSERAQVMAAGFDRHLVKPVDLQQLEAILAGLGQQG